VSGDETPGPLFERRGEQFLPTGLTTGPWRSDAMHGGPPSALIGALVTDAVEEGEQVAGVQIDLEGPVPLEPITAVVRRRSLSRRVAHLLVELHAPEGRVVAAKALVLAGEPIPTVEPEDIAPEGPGGLGPMSWPVDAGTDEELFHRDAVDYRFVTGGFHVPGHSSAWLRLRGPVIAGEPPCGLSSLLAVADFGSALSQSPVPGSRVGLINVDVNITLFRTPVGPWFFLDATGFVSDQGVGLATTGLRDVTGPLGTVTQSQIAYTLRPDR